MPYTNLIANLTPATRDQYIAEINAIRIAMNFLVLLTGKEKKKQLRLGSKAESFFDKTVMLAAGNPSILTNIVSLPNLQTRTNDLKHLKAIQSQARRMCEALDDTVLALEQENMRECLYIYKLAQGAASQNVAGATAIVQALETMLPRTGKKMGKKDAGKS